MVLLFLFVLQTEQDASGFIFRRLDGPQVEEAATDKTSDGQTKQCNHGDGSVSSVCVVISEMRNSSGNIVQLL